MLGTRPGMLLITLGVAHGLADGAAGWLLGQTLVHHSSATLALGILLYNGLAFGGQPLVGIWVDRHRCAPLTTRTALGLLALALLMPDPIMPSPLVAIALAGLGSAGFHPGAGAIASRLAAGRATALGVFTAPGIVGLSLGTALGWMDWPLALPLEIALVGLAVALAALGNGVVGATSGATSVEPSSPSVGGDESRSHQRWREGLLLGLLGAIALRSALWVLIQVIHQQNTLALVTLGIAAAIGKGIGGYGSDRLGSRRWLGAALVGAILCLPWPWLPLQAVGVALLQSTVPLAWQAVIPCLPQQRATAAGLTLGLAVAIGGLWLLPGLVITALGLTLPADL